MAVSAHAHYKWPKWLKSQNPAKTQAMYETGHGELNLYNINAKRTTVAVSAHT